MHSEREHADTTRPAPRPGTRFAHLRNRYLLLSDVGVMPLAAMLAFAIRFEATAWPAGTDRLLAIYLALALPLKLLVMWRLGLYRRLWRYAGIGDLQYLGVAALGAALAGAVVGAGVVPALLPDHARVSLTVLVLDAFLAGAFIAAPRLMVRIGTPWPRPASRGVPASPPRRVLIVGAGAAGSMIARELQNNAHLRLLPVAFVDDDPSKIGRRLLDIPVVGPLDSLGAAVTQGAIEEVVIALPTAPGRVVRAVLSRAAEAGVPTRTVPGLFELLEGRKSVSALREVQIEDLLRRDPIRTDLARVRTLAVGKTVLVTGAGGSIGRELCRQLARLEPACIVAVGRGENSVFELVQELTRTYPGTRVEPVIADVRDAARLEPIFRTFRPATVFHAAAHKHVPLMERNVAEAVLNNVLGTQAIADLAVEYGVERFILISSDKAVRPSSIMGATKRLAEGIVQEAATRSGRHFASVRFGNVLGSRGSVIPIFLQQIQAGGPLTITHPDMRRYFMTIPEAVQLVLQAGAMAKGSEVFVLDMGEPIRVVDLARDLIRLSGLEEGQDIEIRFTGIRPGEKLTEELFFSAENASPTAHPKVLRAKNAALAFPGNVTVSDLIAMAWRNASPDELRRAIQALLPEYSGIAPEPAAAHAAAAPAGPVPAESAHPAGRTAPRLVSDGEVRSRAVRDSGRGAAASAG